MKLNFNNTFACFVAITLSINIDAAKFIYLSGQVNERTKVIVNKKIENEYKQLRWLFKWDLSNKTCALKKNALIQLCFFQDNFNIVTQDKALIRKTLERYIKLAKTQKAIQKDGQQ